MDRDKEKDRGRKKEKRDPRTKGRSSSIDRSMKPAASRLSTSSLSLPRMPPSRPNLAERWDEIRARNEGSALTSSSSLASAVSTASATAPVGAGLSTVSDTRTESQILPQNSQPVVYPPIIQQYGFPGQMGMGYNANFMVPGINPQFATLPLPLMPGPGANFQNMPFTSQMITLAPQEMLHGPSSLDSQEQQKPPRFSLYPENKILSTSFQFNPVVKNPELDVLVIEPRGSQSKSDMPVLLVTPHVDLQMPFNNSAVSRAVVQFRQSHNPERIYVVDPLQSFGYPDAERLLHVHTHVLFCDHPDQLGKLTELANMKKGSCFMAHEWFFAEPEMVPMFDENQESKMRFVWKEEWRPLVTVGGRPMQQWSQEVDTLPIEQRIRKKLPVAVCLAPVKNGCPVVIYLPAFYKNAYVTDTTTGIKRECLVLDDRLIQFFNRHQRYRCLDAESLTGPLMDTFRRNCYPSQYMECPELHNFLSWGLPPLMNITWQDLSLMTFNGDYKAGYSEAQIKSTRTWLKKPRISILTQMQFHPSLIEVDRRNLTDNFWTRHWDITDPENQMRIMMTGFFVKALHGPNENRTDYESQQEKLLVRYSQQTNEDVLESIFDCNYYLSDRYRSRMSIDVVIAFERLESSLGFEIANEPESYFRGSGSAIYQVFNQSEAADRRRSRVNWDNAIHGKGPLFRSRSMERRARSRVRLLTNMAPSDPPVRPIPPAAALGVSIRDRRSDSPHHRIPSRDRGTSRQPDWRWGRGDSSTPPVHRGEASRVLPEGQKRRHSRDNHASAGSFLKESNDCNYFDESHSSSFSDWVRDGERLNEQSSVIFRPIDPDVLICNLEQREKRFRPESSSSSRSSYGTGVVSPGLSGAKINKPLRSATKFNPVLQLEDEGMIKSDLERLDIYENVQETVWVKLLGNSGGFKILESKGCNTLCSAINCNFPAIDVGLSPGVVVIGEITELDANLSTFTKLDNQISDICNFVPSGSFMPSTGPSEKTKSQRLTPMTITVRNTAVKEEKQYAIKEEAASNRRPKKEVLPKKHIKEEIDLVSSESEVKDYVINQQLEDLTCNFKILCKTVSESVTALNVILSDVQDSNLGEDKERKRHKKSAKLKRRLKMSPSSTADRYSPTPLHIDTSSPASYTPTPFSGPPLLVKSEPKSPLGSPSGQAAIETETSIGNLNDVLRQNILPYDIQIFKCDLWLFYKINEFRVAAQPLNVCRILERVHTIVQFEYAALASRPPCNSFESSEDLEEYSNRIIQKLENLHDESNKVFTNRNFDCNIKILAEVKREQGAIDVFEALVRDDPNMKQVQLRERGQYKITFSDLKTAKHFVFSCNANFDLIQEDGSWGAFVVSDSLRSILIKESERLESDEKDGLNRPGPSSAPQTQLPSGSSSVPFPSRPSSVKLANLLPLRQLKESKMTFKQIGKVIIRRQT